MNDPLNNACARFNAGLKMAMTAVHLLSDRGIEPSRILIDEHGARRPLIEIATPRDDAWLRGSAKSRVVIQGTAYIVMAAPFHGCQLEWKVVLPAEGQAVGHA